MPGMRKIEQNAYLIGFLLLPVTMLLLFVIYPAIDLARLSLTDWNGFSPHKHFIGLTNYRNLFQSSPDVWLALKNNGVYFFATLIFVPLQLIVAVLLNRAVRGMKIFKSIIFMPYIINGVAVAFMFSMFFSPVDGGFNGILTALGMKSLIHNWLSDPHIVMYTISFVAIWRYSGFNIILFGAALQSIPKELMEAAVVDGANAVQMFFRITVPSIMRTVQIVFFMTLAGALGAFDIPFVMTNGGPNHASSTFITYSIEMAFKYNNFGMAGAMAIVLIGIVIVATTIQSKLLGKLGD